MTQIQSSALLKSNLLDLKDSPHYEIIDQSINAKKSEFQHGKFTWSSNETYEGQFADGKRNGKGKQTWKDGSVYEGNYVNDLRQGQGKLVWASGQTYEGEFYKDHLHGKGCYTWPNGSSFDGRFYQSQKDGYGEFCFSNGDKFEGLYKQDERFGPGVLSYHNEPNVQDLGIWHRHRLVRICGSSKDPFTMDDHPEYGHISDDQKTILNFASKDCSYIDDKLSRDLKLYTFLSQDVKQSLCSESITLPKGIETYCRDFHHLPFSKSLRKEWDDAYSCSESSHVCLSQDQSSKTAVNRSSLSMNIERHMHRHRNFPSSNEANNVMSAKRKHFTSDVGKLEKFSRKLIDAAGEGNFKRVSTILESGLIDPNVCDRQGNFALMAAAVNLHLHVVNLLLDFGANVNQLTDEGVSCLNACMLYYFPVDHFKPNIAEQYIKNYQKAIEKMERKKNSVDNGSDNDIDNPESIDLESNVSTLDLDDMDFISDRRILRKYREEKIAIDLPTTAASIASHQSQSSVKAPEFRSISRNTDIFQDDRNSKSVQNRGQWKDFGSIANMVKLDYDITDDLIDKTANLLSLNERAVRGLTCRDRGMMKEGTLQALTVWKAEHASMRKMIDTLLSRGANPNVSSYPFYPIFYAVKCGDCEVVKSLLERGASTSVRLSDELGGLTPLHIACAVQCDEGPHLVELLLQAGADPNSNAHDDHITHDMGKDQIISEDSLSNVSLPRDPQVLRSIPWMTDNLKFVEDKGRTPLHVACDRDDNYECSRRIIHLLLDNGANPNVLWSGHSPLSMAAASGNDSAIDELVKFGADPSLPLTQSLGSLLCVAADPQHEYRRKTEDRIKLVDKLVAAGANILSPVMFGKNRLIGTAVDYVHWKQSEDVKIFKTPYHALSKEERKIFNARKMILSHLALHLRRAAVTQERSRLRLEFKDGFQTCLVLSALWSSKKKRSSLKRRSPSRRGRFLYTGAGATLGQQSPTQQHQEGSSAKSRQGTANKVSFIRGGDGDNQANGDALNKSRESSASNSNETKSSTIRKPLFKYCYNCSRSVGVRLQPCMRCHEVYYCSKACKLTAWEERHKEECRRVKKVRTESPLPTESETELLFREKPLEETIGRAGKKTSSVIEAILDRHIALAELNKITLSRHGGLSLLTRSRLDPNLFMKKPIENHGDHVSIKKISSASGSAKRRNISGYKQRPNAHVDPKHKEKIGRNVEWHTDGTTLHYLNVRQNYSYV